MQAHHIGKEYEIEQLTEDSSKGVEIALFCSGGLTSKNFVFVLA
jgi:hypothetical protein